MLQNESGSCFGLVLVCFCFWANWGDNISGSGRGRKQWLFSDFFICVPVFVARWASVPQRAGDHLGKVEWLERLSNCPVNLEKLLICYLIKETGIESLVDLHKSSVTQLESEPKTPLFKCTALHMPLPLNKTIQQC